MVLWVFLGVVFCFAFSLGIFVSFGVGIIKFNGKSEEILRREPDLFVDRSFELSERGTLQGKVSVKETSAGSETV